MIRTKTNTDHMIDQLNAAEEVMAMLDQHAGTEAPLGRHFASLYKATAATRDRAAEDWNGDLYPDEVTIYRCSYADKPYHTDADGPCDVWGTQPVCELHQQLAIEQSVLRAKEEA